MKKLVIAAFAVFAVPALATPHGFSAVKNARALESASRASSQTARADSRADSRAESRSSVATKMESRELPKAMQSESSAPEANR